MIKNANYTIWGKDLDPTAILRMDDAVNLPISIKGTLIPDTHRHSETSGSESHFAEFGKLTLLQDDIGLKLEIEEYIEFFNPVWHKGNWYQDSRPLLKSREKASS